MINVLRRVLPLMDRQAQTRFILACGAMLVLAVMEGMALLTVAPLMLILTAPGMHSSSSLVREMSSVLGHPSASDLAIELGVFTIVLYVAKDVLALVVTRWTVGLCLTQEVTMVRRLMGMYMKGPYREHLRTNSSEFVRTLSTSVRQIFSTGIIASFSALGDLFSVVLVAGILLVTSPVIAAATFVYFGVVAFFYQRVLHRVLAERSRKLHEMQAIDYQMIHQALSGVKEIKVRGSEDYYTDAVYRVRSGLVPAYRTMALLSITPRYVLELAMVGATATIAGLTYSTEPAATATATLALFLAGGFRLLAPMNKVMFGLGQARSSRPAIEQVERDFALFAGAGEASTGSQASIRGEAGTGVEDGQSAPRVEIAATPSAPAQRDTVGGSRISVADVCFSYEPGRPVLQHVNFEIAPGEAIGLVGGSGAGKSTLLDILLGLLVPDSGRVLIGGQDMQSVLREWRTSIGYVPQSIALFDDTVAANVALGLAPQDIDVEAVWTALKLAQLDETVHALPEGIDTLVGESGVRLSGGQRQRLGVARALYHNPAVLMFDEATSALDNETEFKLTEVLEGLHDRVTTVTIAHRLSTVRRCDRILYMEDGTVAADGTFEELFSTNSGFARLVELSDLGVDA